MWALVRVVLVVAAAVAGFTAPVAGAYALHAVSYRGTCGPHAPDIAAHACDRATYLAEFGAGFAGVGLMVLTAAVGVPLAIVMGSFAVVRTRRRRGRLPASEAG